MSLVVFLIVIIVFIRFLFSNDEPSEQALAENKEKLDKYFKGFWDPIMHDVSAIKINTGSRIDMTILTFYTDSTNLVASDQYYQIRLYLYDAPFIPYRHLDWNSLVSSQLYKNQPIESCEFSEEKLWQINSDLSATFTSTIYKSFFVCGIDMNFDTLKKQLELRYAARYDNLHFSSTHAYVQIS